MAEEEKKADPWRQAYLLFSGGDQFRELTPTRDGYALGDTYRVDREIAQKYSDASPMKDKARYGYVVKDSVNPNYQEVYEIVQDPVNDSVFSMRRVGIEEKGESSESSEGPPGGAPGAVPLGGSIVENTYSTMGGGVSYGSRGTVSGSAGNYTVTKGEGGRVVVEDPNNLFESEVVRGKDGNNYVRVQDRNGRETDTYLRVEKHGDLYDVKGMKNVKNPSFFTGTGTGRRGGGSGGGWVGESANEYKNIKVSEDGTQVTYDFISGGGRRKRGTSQLLQDADGEKYIQLDGDVHLQLNERENKDGDKIYSAKSLVELMSGSFDPVSPEDSGGSKKGKVGYDLKKDIQEIAAFTNGSARYVVRDKKGVENIIDGEIRTMNGGKDFYLQLSDKDGEPIEGTYAKLNFNKDKRRFEVKGETRISDEGMFDSYKTTSKELRSLNSKSYSSWMGSIVSKAAGRDKVEEVTGGNYGGEGPGGGGGGRVGAKVGETTIYLGGPKAEKLMGYVKKAAPAAAVVGAGALALGTVGVGAGIASFTLTPAASAAAHTLASYAAGHSTAVAGLGGLAALKMMGGAIKSAYRGTERRVSGFTGRHIMEEAPQQVGGAGGESPGAGSDRDAWLRQEFGGGQ
ncbi:MAG: hypothetical protein JW727_02250 [Candidatus Aenigmarchaeota archaeon]|nr:hypothetical protein [Candidatus Aenigmarchaeota archaeon]